MNVTDYYYKSTGKSTPYTGIDLAMWAQLQREMAQSFNQGFFSQNTIEEKKIEKIKNQNVLLLLL